MVSRYQFMLDDAHYIVSGFIGSYANFFFTVEHNQLTEFVTLIKNARTKTDIKNL